MIQSAGKRYAAFGTLLIALGILVSYVSIALEFVLWSAGVFCIGIAVQYAFHSKVPAVATVARYVGGCSAVLLMLMAFFIATGKM